ncbi:hypothetical protein CEXT_99791 [Caerostris extrusa]|uniref:Uncharacterized protein n=1 Tax=Caerostris extrusa TaxID=172846 RepID=A0AAV4SWK9_CAEEX|nr:hypothetical protein CEXT_99791 [Caerostris extrusa]
MVRQSDKVKDQLKIIHNNITDDSIKINLSLELIKIYPNSEENRRKIITMLQTNKFDYLISPKIGKYNEELMKLTELLHGRAHKGEECLLPKELDPAAFIPNIAIVKFDV